MTAAVIPLARHRSDITPAQRERLANVALLMFAAARTPIGKGWQVDTGTCLHSHHSVAKVANGPAQVIDLWCGVVEAELASETESSNTTFHGMDLSAIRDAITALRERAQAQN